MRNNPGENIKIDWKINEIVKPGHVNALTKAIKYDYVVPADKVTTKSSLGADPDDLYELCGSPAKVDSDISILINTTMGVTLRGVSADESEYIAGPLFKIDPSDFVSSGNSVHIYALCNGPCGGFGIKVVSHRTVFVHTSGKFNAAVFLPGSERCAESDIYVGSAWDMDQIDNSASRGGIVYEQACDDKLPQGDVTRSAWMSNGMGAGGGGGRSNVLKLCAYGRPYDTFDVNPSHTDPEDIDGRALDLEGYDAVEWSTNLDCEDHIEAEHGIQLDAPFASYSGSIVSDANPIVYVNPENCKSTGATFTIKSVGALPIEDGAAISFSLDGGFTATGLSGDFSAQFYGTIKYTGVTISGADAATTISGGVARGGDISGTFSGGITSGGISGDALSFDFAPNFSGKISGSIAGGNTSTGASLNGTGTIQILDRGNRPVITLNVESGTITSGEINEAKVEQMGDVHGGTDSSNPPRITKFIPARYLTINPDTMAEGKVYPIHIKCWSRGGIMSFNLLLNKVSYPVYVHCPTHPRIPQTVGDFSKFGYDADGYYMIDSSNNKFSIKSFDGSPLDWTESSFEMNMTTAPASGFEPLKASGTHNDGNNHSVTFTARHPDTPGASFSLFEIRILDSDVYLLNKEGAEQVRPKMVTVAPPDGSDWGQSESPAPYAGTVYLMKKNGKVYALGY